MPEWKSLGQGGYNTVFISHTKEKLIAGSAYEGPWVFKQSLKKVDAYRDWQSKKMSNPNRALRLMGHIQPSLPVAHYSKDGVEGWIMPFIPQNKPTDVEIADEVIAIFLRTRRIVVDACGMDNLLKTADGEIICVDVDLALRRSDSKASIDYTNDIYARFETYWQNDEFQNKQETILIVKTLLRLEDQVLEHELAYEAITRDMIRASSWFIKQNRKLSPEIIASLSALDRSHMEFSPRWADAIVRLISRGFHLTSENIEKLSPLVLGSKEITTKDINALLFQKLATLQETDSEISMDSFSDVANNQEAKKVDDPLKGSVLRGEIERQVARMQTLPEKPRSKASINKIQAINDAMVLLTDDKKISKALHNEGSTLYLALNCKRYLPVTYVGMRHGFFSLKSKSLLSVCESLERSERALDKV